MKQDWNILEFDISDPIENKRDYIFFLNGMDFIVGSINSWNGKKPEKITLKATKEDRRFIKANYCEKYDHIEIHYILDQKFKVQELAIDDNKNCIVNCTKVIFVEYTINDLDEHGNVKEYFICKTYGGYVPGHKKGSIIVGNP